MLRYSQKNDFWLPFRICKCSVFRMWHFS